MRTDNARQFQYRSMLDQLYLAEKRPGPFRRRRVRKWVEALRSGDYRQGRKALRRVDTDSYCCLGVACDLYPRKLIRHDVDRYLDGDSVRVTRFGDTNIVLPKPVARWLGFERGNPQVIVPGDHETDLADLNDVGLTFTEIADVIERSWLKK